MDRKQRKTIEHPLPTAAAAPWIELPQDVTADILQRLGAEEMLESAQKVCTRWRKVCQDPSMWRLIHLKNRFDDSEEEFDLICRCAVDRSQGQLIDLNIAGFGDDALLYYVADRSSHLQRLTLADCDISRTALTDAVKRLAELEELHLLALRLLRGQHVETIGISCPMLKSFTLYEHWSHPESPDDLALAIGKTMSNLRNLRLIALPVKNEGLEAVLDGCPLLESLDLRQCYGLDLRGDLGKRCREQIKDLRLPGDSISDLEYVRPSGDSLYDYSRNPYYYDSSDGDSDEFVWFDDVDD